jgi:PGF-pre-PGF domain-containing protein
MEEPDASVYRYFKVRYDKDSYVENASLDFHVNTSWLEGNNISQNTVKLYRYTTVWEELDTKILNEDSEDIYFEVTTPGFSWFDEKPR